MEQECDCKSPADMQALGQKLASELQSGSCVALLGPLGAGKTQFVKGLAAGLGYFGDVTSPTFSLLHEYRGGREDLFHLDFYRIEAESELVDLGWDELLEDGVVVAEWADKFPALLPPSTRWIRISHLKEGERRLRMGIGSP
jgi:tRNA threonylcarbamoyladenosine biosynthesis protein TsaE